MAEGISWFPMESYLTAEISAEAVRANLKLLRQCLAPGTGLCAVVKSDCYGLGVPILLPAISELSDCLAVATPEEAIELRRLGYKGKVLLLFPSGAYAEDGHKQHAWEELIADNVTLTLVSAEDVEMVAATAARLGVTAKVHVKIDTGMSRGGVGLGEALRLVNEIHGRPGIALGGLYTHFASADEHDLKFTREQLGRFWQAVEACGPREGLTLHAANSAATIQVPESHFDMVRPGIAIYGYQPSEHMQRELPLKPALRLWARLMQVKNVPAGSSCGYGLTRMLNRDSRLGLVPVGYADGYFRSLSNRATMRVAGRDVPVVGLVSMDQTIVDLTDVPHARVGDPVEVISSDPTASNSAERLAKLAGTIPYELISGIGRRAKRVAAEGEYVPAAQPSRAGHAAETPS